jgi:hypothetical protein
MLSPADFLRLYALAGVLGACFTLKTIGAEEVRKHPLAAALTAAVCGLLWPILLIWSPKEDRRER